MYKVIDGVLYKVEKVETKDIENRLFNAGMQVENLNKQIISLQQEKENILLSVQDLKDVAVQLYPNEAKKLGF